MESERGVERIVFFTDAVVAIAITLLALPLVDVIAAGASGASEDLGGLLVHHASEFGGFLLSFILIARLWYSHHQLFESVRRYSGVLVAVNFAWTGTLVLLPVVTAMATGFSTQTASGRLAFLLYAGTLLLSSVVLAVLTVVLHRSRQLWDGPSPVTQVRVNSAVVAAFLFALVLVVGAAAPAVNYWAFWLFLLSAPLERAIRWILARARRRSGVVSSANQDAG